MLDLKINKKKLAGKLALSAVVLIALFYAWGALVTLNNRVTYTLPGTAWLSREKGKIEFTDSLTGFYTDEEDLKTQFDYETGRGYVVCKVDDEVLLELAGLKDNRLYAVNRNAVFYDIAYL